MDFVHSSSAFSPAGELQFTEEEISICAIDFQGKLSIDVRFLSQPQFLLAN